jgi:hypothetical protein
MDEGVDPKNLSRQMVTTMDEYAQIESLSNPEIRSLFIDWMEELEKEILDFYKKGKADAPDKLAGQFGISRKSADFLIKKMKQEGKIE